LYRETAYGDEADEKSTRSTRPDFLERFLDNFESILTPLEGRIAYSYLVTDPHTAPEEALEWLGSWIGVLSDNGVPKHLRRELISNAPRLFRMRGTLEGLALALELATGGSISGGEIVILEEFRLRRTLATILGADLADEDDPLLGGLAHTGNSFVGDTLFLGDENRHEFLALFSDDLSKTKSERDAVDLLFSRLAHRVLVLVHSEVEPQNRRLIERIVELEKPAHVVARVEDASTPFLVGAASLVGIDTYLARKPGPQPVRVGSSQVGVRDVILGTGGLDPRRESGYYASAQPIARVTPETVVDIGTGFTLDGSESTAPSGRTIKRFMWSLRDTHLPTGEGQ
jgi:phage tail-like protein